MATKLISENLSLIMSGGSKEACSICVFCYKTTTTSHSSYNFQKNDNGNKFSDRVMLVNSFLDLLDRHVNQTGGNRESAPDFKWPDWLSSCKSCFGIVKEFFALYHQMKLLELQLDLRLQRLTSYMELAGRIPTRWAKLQQIYERRQAHNYLSDGKDPNCLSNLRRFRQNIIKKCSRRLSKLQPRVLIREKVKNHAIRSHDKIASDPEEENGTDLCETALSEASGITNEPVLPEDGVSYCTSMESEAPLQKSKTVTKHVIVVKFETPEAEVESEKMSPSQPNKCEESQNECQPKSEKEDPMDGSDPNDEDFIPDHNDYDDAISHQSDSESCDPVGDDITPHKKTLTRKRRPKYSMHKCPQCDKTYKRNDSMVQHMGRVHNQGTPFPCEICDSVFYTDKKLKEHIRVIHGERSHKCTQCGTGFKAGYKLKEHISIVHNNKHKFKCDECGSVLNSKRAMKHHALMHKGPSVYRFRCSLCDYKCMAKNRFVGHMKAHKNASKLFNCKLCSCKFITSFQLSFHVKHEHMEKEDVAK